MAVTPNLQKVFGGTGGVVDLLTKLERQNGVLRAVNHQNGSGDLLQFGLRIELPVNQQTQARQKPKYFAGDARC